MSTDRADNLTMIPALRSFTRLAWLGSCVCLSLAARAQPVPDAGSLLREAERTPAVPPVRPATQAVQTPASPSAPRTAAGPRFVVKAVTVVGATLIDPAELQRSLRLGREMSFADLEDIGRSIAEIYRRAGWFARVQLPAQDISDGTVRFQVIEGRLGAVTLDDGGQALRVNRALIDGTFTARQKPGTPLRMDELERATNLLNDTPGVEVAATLAPGLKTGESDLLLRVRDKPLWRGAAAVDNQGAHSTGTGRVSLNLYLDNPGGGGDQGLFGAVVSQGSRYARLGYTTALGHDGLRVGLNGSVMRYRLLDEFEILDAHGSAHTMAATASYPLARSLSRNLGLSFAFERRGYGNEANQIETSRKRVDLLSLGLSGDVNDDTGNDASGRGFWLWSATLATGRLDLSDNPASASADADGPRSQGRFTKLVASLARLQPFTPSTGLWLSASGQLANRNLDSSEKFSPAGLYGVRAVPALDASGDAGWVATAELRHVPWAGWQALAFYDQGAAQVNHSAYVGAALSNRVALRGFGLGLNWSPAGRFALRTAWARRVENTAGTASGANKYWVTGICSF